MVADTQDSLGRRMRGRGSKRDWGEGGIVMLGLAQIETQTWSRKAPPMNSITHSNLPIFLVANFLKTTLTVFQGVQITKNLCLRNTNQILLAKPKYADQPV